MKSLLVFSIVLAGGVSQAQFKVVGATGDFTQGGAPISVGDELDQNARLYAADGTSSFNLSNRTIAEDYASFSRSIVGFKSNHLAAGESGDTLDIQMPSDRMGGMSTASDGEVRLFSMTSDNYVGQNKPFSFQSQITTTGSAAGEVLMESLGLGGGSPYSHQVASGGFSITNLDNGSWDLDPAVGKVLIDRAATPTVTLDYTLPQYSVQRTGLNLFGQDRANPFYDRYFGGILYFLSTATDFRGVGWQDFNANQEFAPGDMSSKTLPGASGSLVFNFAPMLGTYTMSGGSLIWDWMGDDAGFPATFYPATGTFINPTALEVRVVPEPNALLPLIVGLGALALRRKRR